MTAESHQQLKALFDAARARPKRERGAFLDDQCGGDEALRREIDSLLAHHDEDPEFLSRPALRPEPGRAEGDAPAEVPSRIGRYEIVGVLGEGGMGTVYEARQDHPRRVVALKVIRAGVASRGTLRRFEHEAQVLARLQHPGIAQIHEAGTFGSGRASRPYFAMELIRGRTLLEYAETRRLATRERLALLARICDAIQHAHQKGVVHRDLKPANILVDERGQPKVLDFGVARATDADVQATTLRTDVSQVLGTIPYMSPEQVVGDSGDLDTRSDVYALGVVGYELLAGRLPLDVREKTIAEAARIIREVDPAGLSAVDRAFRGDVATIIGRALEKDKERRYQSAADLAADLRRYLADEPIVARSVSTLYQLRKFTKRNRPLVGGAAVALLALMLGLVTTTWQAVAATRERDRAERESRKAQTVRTFLEETLGQADPWSARGGPDVTLAEVVEEAARRLPEQFAEHRDVEADLHLTMGRIYEGLGEYEKSRTHLAAALEIRRLELGDRDPEIARLLHGMAWINCMEGDYRACREYCDQALALQRELLGGPHADIAVTLRTTGIAEFRLGAFAEAERLLRESLEMYRALGRGDSLAAASPMNFLGYVVKERGDLDAALDLYTRALEIRRRHLGDDSMSVATSINNLGMLHLARGELALTEARLREALARRSRHLDDDHPFVLHGQSNVALVTLTLGRYAEAEAILRNVLRVTDSELAPAKSRDYSRLGRALEGQGRLDEAEACFRIALESSRKDLPGDHPDAAGVLSHLAALLVDAGRPEEAEPLARESIAIFESVVGRDHRFTLPARLTLARIMLAHGAVGDAEVHLRDLVARADRTLPPAHWRHGVYRREHGRCLRRAGRHEEAETELVAAAALHVDKLPPPHRERRRSIGALVELYEAGGRLEEAATWRAKMHADDP